MKKLNLMNNQELTDFQKSCKKELQKNGRELSRTLNKTKILQESSKKELELAVKQKKDKTTCRIYANNFMKAKSNYEKLLNQNNKIKEMEYQINSLITEVKLTNTFKANAEIMKNINSLHKVDELSKTLENLHMNLDKAGVINETINDIIEVDDEIDLDEEAENLLDKLNNHYKIWDNEEMNQDTNTNSKQVLNN